MSSPQEAVLAATAPAAMKKPASTAARKSLAALLVHFFAPIWA